MHFNKKGFTVREMVISIVVICILVTVLAPFAIRAASRTMVKAHAAADAATLRSTITNVSIGLLEEKSMDEITQELQPAGCETDPDAGLWLNYSKPISLNAFFVDKDQYYSIDYFSDVALNGSSDLDLKEPLTLGFWYEAGSNH